MKQIIFLILFVSNTDCVRDSDLSDEKDIFEYETRQLDYVNLESMKLVKPGVTSEAEIYKIFGRRIYERNTFSPILQMLYRRKNVPIDKMIMYDGYQGIQEKTRNFTQTTATEVLLVKFYLYKGYLQIFSVIHYLKEIEVVTKKSTIDSLEIFSRHPNRAIWGYEFCTSKYYRLIVLKREKDTFVPTRTCYWEEPGFEKRLSENKEYLEFLNDQHYGKKLLEMG